MNKLLILKNIRSIRGKIYLWADKIYLCRQGYYERSEREPNADALIKLADYFGVSIDYLTGMTDKPEVNK